MGWRDIPGTPADLSETWSELRSQESIKDRLEEPATSLQGGALAPQDNRKACTASCLEFLSLFSPSILTQDKEFRIKSPVESILSLPSPHLQT